MQWSEQIDKIIPALIKAQSKMKKAAKSGYNPHHKSNFSTLEDIFDVAKEPLLENGLVLIQGARNDDAHTYGVDTAIFHISGQWIRDVLMITPSRNDPQGAGSALTYAKRYSALAILAITDGIDDDANLASGIGTSGAKTPLKPLTGPEARDRALELASRTKAKVEPRPATDVWDEPMKPAPSLQSGEYVVSFGKKFPGKRLKDINPDELASYCDWIVKSASDKGQPPSRAAQEFLNAVNAYAEEGLMGGAPSPSEDPGAASQEPDFQIPF